MRPLVPAAVIAALCAAGPGSAAPTVIDFEGVAPFVNVTTQFGARGVVFPNHFLTTSPGAHSGTQVLLTASPSAEIFRDVVLTMTFTAPQARVSLFAAASNVAGIGTLTAFDANGAVIASDGPKPVAVDSFTTPFGVVDGNGPPSIVRVELSLPGFAHFGIDDLEFDGVAPPPPPPPPVVAITAPADGSALDQATLDIAGTVTGQALVSPVTMTVDYRLPPESTAPVFVSDLSLTGAGTTRSFGLQGFTGLPMGPITITVDASNAGGVHGSASATFTNLPAPILSRLAAEGGPGAAGAFDFGLTSQGCRMAVYAQTMISVDAGGTTHVVRGSIFQKWLSMRALFDTDGIGCPLGEEHAEPNGGLAQDFAEGRIYAHPTVGTFEVPKVFVDVIDKRGGEAATGVPMADPTASSGVMRTWLFQKFVRPSRPDLQPSTIEIRGTPPVLWLERQSGDMSLATTGTIWESFGCSDLNGPCDVPPIPPEAPRISNAGAQFCDDTTYPFGPPEWSAILGDHVSTPLFGVATESNWSSEDNPFTHENQYEINCPAKVNCPSDWTVHVKPVGPQRNLGPFQSILAGNDQVEIEYEEYYAQYAHVFMDWPEVGDLFFAAGRWIVDCGHDSYNTELHPIFMFSKMKAAQRFGHVATRADVWVNGWYPGDPIEFDIFPPPRPSPDSLLTVDKPVDADAAFDVDLTMTMDPPGSPNHAHVTFTAAPREVEVTGAGEMLFQSGRGYEGQWYLFWSN